MWKLSGGGGNDKINDLLKFADEEHSKEGNSKTGELNQSLERKKKKAPTHMSEQTEIYKGMGKKFSKYVLACFSIQQ